MNHFDKPAKVIIPFTESIYTKEDISFMLPGILLRFFKNNTILFDDLVFNSIGTTLIDDRGAYFIKESYYEIMAEAIGNYLRRIGYEHLFLPLLDTHDVTDIHIDGVWTMHLTFEPKYDHKDIAQVKIRERY